MGKNIYNLKNAIIFKPSWVISAFTERWFVKHLCFTWTEPEKIFDSKLHASHICSENALPLCSLGKNPSTWPHGIAESNRLHLLLPLCTLFSLKLCRPHSHDLLSDPCISLKQTDRGVRCPLHRIDKETETHSLTVLSFNTVGEISSKTCMWSSVLRIVVALFQREMQSRVHRIERQRTWMSTA